MKIAVPTEATAGTRIAMQPTTIASDADGHQRLPAARQALADLRVHRRSSDLHAHDPKPAIRTRSARVSYRVALPSRSICLS